MMGAVTQPTKSNKRALGKWMKSKFTTKPNNNS